MATWRNQGVPLGGVVLVDDPLPHCPLLRPVPLLAGGVEELVRLLGLLVAELLVGLHAAFGRVGERELLPEGEEVVDPAVVRVGLDLLLQLLGLGRRLGLDLRRDGVQVGADRRGVLRVARARDGRQGVAVVALRGALPRAELRRPGDAVCPAARHERQFSL